MHPTNRRPGDTAFDQQVGEHRVDARPAISCGDALVAEHDLRGAGDRRTGVGAPARLFMNAADRVGGLDQFRVLLIPVEPEVGVPGGRPPGAGLGADRRRMQRRGAGDTQDRDRRINPRCVRVQMPSGGAFGGPPGDRHLLRRWRDDMDVGVPRVEDGEMEPELAGLADIAEVAEQAGEVREVAVVGEPGDHLQPAPRPDFDRFDR